MKGKSSNEETKEKVSCGGGLLLHDNCTVVILMDPST